MAGVAVFLVIWAVVYTEATMPPTTPSPPTTLPMTSPPTTSPLTTSPPTTSPLTTSPPTTPPPTTSPSTTSPPTTSPLTTSPPTTSPPTTSPLTTSPPTTSPPTTSPLTTSPLTTPPPKTSPSTTPSPTTQAPVDTEVLAKIVSDRLNAASYDQRQRPGIVTEPLQVYININVNDISYISETQLEYSMTLFIRQIWTDERIAYEDTGYNLNITLNYKWYDLMWTPDLYVANLKTGTFHKIATPNRRFRLSPNGIVYYSQRLTVTMYCDMVLDRFPMDNQTCYLELGSYAYPTDDLVFHWRFDAVAVEMTRVSLPEYSITNITSIECAPTFAGQWTCLRAYFHLHRRLNKYLLSTYLPSLLVILLSQLSFYINPESAPARTSLGILTVLVITTQNIGLLNSLPFGSGTKAIDVWMVTCLVFVFAAFLEYAAVSVLMHTAKQRTMEDNSRAASGFKDLDGKSVDEKSSTGKASPIFDFKKNPAMALERVSRIFFPFCFIVFCVIYWPYYLIS